MTIPSTTPDRLREAAEKAKAAWKAYTRGSVPAAKMQVTFRDLANPAILALLDKLEGLERERDYWREWGHKRAAETDEQTNRAVRAESALSALQGRVGEYRELISAILSSDREALADHRPKFGIADCVDNTGKPYQSAYLADVLDRARVLLSTEGEEKEDV